jgi:hypothetical protein
MKTIDRICDDINRRIQQMNYNEESDIRSHLDDQFIDGQLCLSDYDVDIIADILDVNTDCIHDLLTDIGFEI